jgi:phospholipid-binding lipoprotein MlaA
MLVLAGCASTPEEYRDPRDPLEPWNRAVYQFNDALDRAVIKPVAEGYNKVLPKPVNNGVTNFFGNIKDLPTALNNALQFKFGHAVSDVSRVLINTTVGVLGFMDVASNLDFEKHNEDFGQTLGVWGVPPGPYFVLPILGPSTIRDTGGTVVDWYTDPINIFIDSWQWRYGLIVTRAIDKRAGLLGASKVLQEAALDPYEFLRDSYLQKRLNDVYDGNPPDEFDDALFEEDEAAGQEEGGGAETDTPGANAEDG